MTTLTIVLLALVLPALVAGVVGLWRSTPGPDERGGVDGGDGRGGRIIDVSPGGGGDGGAGGGGAS